MKPFRPIARRPELALTLTLLLAATPALADPLRTPTDVRNEIGEALQAVSQFAAEERDEAVAAARRGLSRLDAEIIRRRTALRENWGEMSEAARADAATAIDALQMARNRLGERLGALEAGAGSAWDDLKTGFADAYGTLSDVWSDEDSAAAARQDG